MTDAAPTVLVVDDEPRIRTAVRRSLFGIALVEDAADGAEALAVLDRRPDVAVVLSDLRMPGMDGASLLAQVRDRHPGVTRLMLTGQADLQTALRVVNDAGVFRFLLKPSPPAELARVVLDAIEQHRTVTAERVLLRDTLRGAATVLVEVLELVASEVHGPWADVRVLVDRMLAVEPVDEAWKVSLAATLAPLGLVALAPDVAARWSSGARLDPADRAEVERVPSISASLLCGIPRIEDVVEIVAGWPAWGDGDDVVARGQRLLAVAHHHVRARAAVGGDDRAALARACAGSVRLPAAEVGLLARVLRARRAPVLTVPLADAPVGAVLVEDACTPSGTVLVRAGATLSAALHARLTRTRVTLGLAEPLVVEPPHADRGAIEPLEESA